MKKRYVYQIMYIIIAVLCVFQNLSWVRTAYMNGFEAGIWDGVFVYSASGFVRSMVVPLVLIYGILYNMRQDFTPVYITHMTDRLKLWNRGMIRAFMIALTSVLIMMFISAVTVLIKTGNTQLVSYYSIIRGEFMLLGMNVPDTNILLMLIMSIFINTMDLFIKLLLAQFIYWITDNQIISVLSVIIMGVIPSRMTKYNNLYHYKPEGGMYYSELLNSQRIIEDVLIFIMVITLIEILARFFLPGKNFYK